MILRITKIILDTHSLTHSLVELVVAHPNRPKIERMWTKLAAGLALIFGFNVAFDVAYQRQILAALLIWLSCGGAKTLNLAYHTLGRDLRAALMVIRLLAAVKPAGFRDESIPKMFAKTVKKHPDKVQFLFEDEKWTFVQVDEASNRVANYFRGAGYGKGDTIALFMENRPQFVIVWLGLSKIGVITSLINTNLRQDALVHSVQKAAECKAMIFGRELEFAVREIAAEFRNNKVSFPLYSSSSPSASSGCKTESGLRNVISADFDSVNLDSGLESASADPVPKEIQDSIGFNSNLLNIYTSGTTGLPKAAVIKHSR